MEFRKVLALRGPNVWADFPVLEAWVHLGELDDQSSDELPGFNDRLKGWLPSLVEHRCSVGTRGGFFERLRRGTYLAHILEHVALELQTLAGTDVGYGRTRQVFSDGTYKVAVEYEEEDLGRAALEVGRALCLAAVHDHPFDVECEVRKLRELARTLLPDPTAAALLAAARKRGVPARRLGGGFLQFGHGSRQRRVRGAETDRTGAVAAAVARDGVLARTLLRAAGVPVTEGRAVDNSDDAWAAALESPLPATLRPRYADNPAPAARGLHTREQVLAAYAAARDQSSQLRVERDPPGAEFRLLVIDGRVAAAAEMTATGPSDVTARVHPEVASRANDAALAVGLDVAGIDVIAQDITRPLEQQGGVVTAVHANPDLGLHAPPGAVATNPAAEAMLEALFPGTENGRVPIVAVTGVNGKTTTTRLIAHLVGRSGPRVGMTCTEGIFVGERRVEEGDCSGPASGRAVLQNPAVEAAVLETARGGILRAGLGFDRCDVAVVTNIGAGDHLGTAAIETPEQLATVKGTLVASVAPTGHAVLKADDPLVAGMASHCKGSVVYFARDERQPVLAAHRSRGGRAAFVRGDVLFLAEGGDETPVTPLSRVPFTHGGRIGFQVENALAAAAAAWCLGVPLDLVQSGLETFHGGLGQAPGRFNLLEVDGATVILDYGHNVSALRAVLDAIAQFPHRRRAVLYSAAGDRRDADMLQQGEMLGNSFDHVYLYEDAYVRGRKPGEIMALFRQGLAAGKRVRTVEEFHGAVKAVEAALAALRPGELLVLQPDTINGTVPAVQQLLGPGRVHEVSLDAALATAKSVTAPACGPAADVRDGRLGKHVHALRPFEKGQTLYRCWGPRLPTRTPHSLQVDADLHIQPPPLLAYIKHSCDPNCGLLIRRGVAEVELHALRPITAGEELTLDFATFEDEVLYLPGPCQCRAPSCRGQVTGIRDLPPERRAAYGPYVAEHLRTTKARAPARA